MFVQPLPDRSIRCNVFQALKLGCCIRMASRDSSTSPSNAGCPRAYSDIPTLDTDIMECICDSIDSIHGLLAVSLTCSMMRSIAIRQLLRTHTIRLTNRHAIRAFHLFILNHKADRAHHIRFLVIPEIVWFGKKIGPGATNDVDKLMDILDCAVNLVHLDLFLRSSESDVDRGRISSAFARMSTLRYLSLRDSDPSGLLEWAQDALSALRSPPRTLCIEAGDDSMMSALDPQPARLLRAVSRFSTSWAVTNLSLACIPMENNAFLGLPPFRSVRSLTITKPLPVPPKLDSLLHLFPSLDGTLRLHLDIPTRIRINKNFRLFSETKQENKHAQDRSRWTGIDRLDCDTETASMLELRCPVRRLALDAFVLNVVVHIKPTHLVVAPMSRFPLSLFPSRMDLQTPAASPHTTHVVLIASCNSRDDFNPFRWDAVYVSRPNCRPITCRQSSPRILTRLPRCVSRSALFRPFRSSRTPRTPASSSIAPKEDRLGKHWSSSYATCRTTHPPRTPRPRSPCAPPVPNCATSS